MFSNFYNIKAQLRLIYRLALMDFRKRYLGNILGMLWAIISPVFTIFIILFVFTYGLKTPSYGGGSFLGWLVPSILIWFFLTEAITSGVGSILDNPYLVKKVNFPLHLLPPAKIIASLPSHLVLVLCFLIYLIFTNQGSPTMWPQLFYYLLCAIFLTLGISYITSTTVIFVRDVMNIVNVCMQMLFWATPIFWDINLVKGTFFHFLIYSPFAYIIIGYRDSLINQIPFWDKPLELLIFWTIVTFVFFSGYLITKRARPHFADVL